MRIQKIVTLLTALICFAPTSHAALDIDAFLKLADGDSIYPSAAQIELLSAHVPDAKIQPAPSINDRVFWERIAASKSGKTLLETAISDFETKPEIPISDAIYRRAQKEGNRGIYKPRYYDTMERLGHFILAECIENKGRFLPQIETYGQSILDMKSWLHPNHDKGCETLDGKSVSIDLGARLFGTHLALAEWLLGDRLPDTLRAEIRKQLRWRITDSYFRTCRGEDEENHWIRSTSNWNSVCTSGSVFVILASSDDQYERLAALGCALNSMPAYMSGFGKDGYCSEGVGYWGYGFGHYLYFAQILHDYSEGEIDLFTFNDADKLQQVARFPERFHIQNGVFPAFSDANITNPTNFGNFGKAVTAKYYGSPWPYDSIQEHMHEQLVQWTALNDYNSDSIPDFQAHSFFDDRGIVISRGQQAVPLSIAFKAGDNDENHNHSDVGTYSIILGETLVAGDIGKPVYQAGAFSPRNKARSSWGHPVPRINGTLQSNGAEHFGKIMYTDFSDARDLVEMDIKAAYAVPALETLIRTMDNEKSSRGAITIKDTFTASEPISFGTTIMTYAEIEFVSVDTILLNIEDQKVQVLIQSDGGTVTFKDEAVPVRLGSGKTAYRIGIDFTQPLQLGSISMQFIPMNPTNEK
ncbi:MAG: hypothetical protein ACN4GF_08585 [Lentimonas sp.]